MTKNRYLIIGAQKPEHGSGNPGGIMVATIGLLEYASQNNIDVDLLNVYSPSFPPPNIFRKIVRFIGRIFELRKMLKANKYSSALIFCSGGLGFVERIVLSSMIERRDTPTILYQVSGHFMDHIKRSKLFTKFAKKLLSVPTFIGAQGSQWIEFYTQLGIAEQRIKLIANWLPNNIKIPDNPPKNPVRFNQIRFIYVGWITRKKGVYDLMEAIENSELLKQCGFNLIGGGNDEEPISEIIREKQLHRVELKGWLDHDKVIEEFKKSHILVFPSHAEGFPNALIEAMSQGLAVVATDVGAIADAIDEGENGYLLQPQNPKQLQEKLEKIVTDYDQISTMGQKSIAIVKRDYSYSSNCKKIFHILDAISR